MGSAAADVLIGGGGPAGPVNGAVAADSAAAARAEAEAIGAVYREIEPSAIQPNPRQPRSVFDADALAELVHSIREFGLMQPIVVRELSQPSGPHRYQLIMGERRWRASQEAGLTAIPAIVRETADDNMLRDALLENRSEEHTSELQSH